MRLKIEAELDYSIIGTAAVLLQVEAAALSDQRLLTQDLRVTSAHPLTAVAGEDGIGQRTWARGEGWFVATYAAEIAIERAALDLTGLAATPLQALPAAAIPYLLPSRYCEVERFQNFVGSEFAGLAGGALASAIAAWVRQNLTYASGSSTGDTTAATTFVERQGVCRDFAHLTVAMCRAGGLPARCVSAYAPGVDPPDFHAVAEVWLADGWHIVDATGMADCGEVARVVVGRDATDIAFMTVFGQAALNRQSVRVTRLG
ncbi:MAG: transglutaminase family protein [Pseudomonadota bacterium]